MYFFVDLGVAEVLVSVLKVVLVRNPRSVLPQVELEDTALNLLGRLRFDGTLFNSQGRIEQDIHVMIRLERSQGRTSWELVGSNSVR